MTAGQYLPPGGKGDREAVDEEWRHLNHSQCGQFKWHKLFQCTFLTKCIQIWNISPFLIRPSVRTGAPSPRGKVLFRRLYKHQLIGQLRKNDMHIRLSTPFPRQINFSAGRGLSLPRWVLLSWPPPWRRSAWSSSPPGPGTAGSAARRSSCPSSQRSCAGPGDRRCRRCLSA